MLTYLLIVSGVVGAALVALVIYGNTLDIHEDEEIYLNKEEEKIMGGEQAILIAKKNQLKKIIFALAIVTGILILSSAAMWVYVGLTRG